MEHKLERAGDMLIQPFAVNFEEPVIEQEMQAGGTNTRSMSDDDTGTYRKDTEDNDT